ncbi:hypothetical protein SAMN02745146_2758 [Hymenobacter daecheongensis DSM 21074]|uniref:Uncharacterized protein n=1 Tax=Hymenobacter daecheongensis DSM 21074 TaxID=1121955 RepID=A0A1M6I2P2_9BACT|nr:hypothetical protein [Hymenobacter daecheongensis]SHJ28524.1 hypothetical protein SAMN02745146_2758 [Hymenobacter daecheongensis DSM 21074]
MKLPFRSFLLAGFSAATLLALPACETTKPKRGGFPEVSGPTSDPDETKRRQLEATSKQVARIAEGKVEYLIPRAQLASAFIREFKDGTVVDKTMIRKVQESPKDKAIYYLVGMGLRNGMFRSMAIPLETSTDKSLYLNSNAERYIITSVGCNFCYFSFEKNRIVGTTCEDNSGGSRCDLVVENTNGIFRR